MEARGFKFTIPGRLPGLNEIIEAARKGHHVSRQLKRETEAIIGAAIMAGKPRVVKFDCPVSVWFRFYEPNRRRDYDNIEAGRKFILDALVDAGVIKGDGQKYLVEVKPFQCMHHIDKDNPRVEVDVWW